MHDATNAHVVHLFACDARVLICVLEVLDELGCVFRDCIRVVVVQCFRDPLVGAYAKFVSLMPVIVFCVEGGASCVVLYVGFRAHVIKVITMSTQDLRFVYGDDTE